MKKFGDCRTASTAGSANFSAVTAKSLAPEYGSTRIVKIQTLRAPALSRQRCKISHFAAPLFFVPVGKPTRTACTHAFACAHTCGHRLNNAPFFGAFRSDNHPGKELICLALTFVGGLTLESRRKNIVLPIEDASLPAVVRLKLQDNCIPVVCAGEKVAEGEKVAANADGFCLLSSVCGTVMSAGDGFVTVRSERSGEPVGLPPVESPVVSLSYEDVSERLKQAGIVGAMSGIIEEGLLKERIQKIFRNS